MTGGQGSPWRVLVHTRRDTLLSTAVASAGGVVDETELIHRHDRPADGILAACRQAGESDWVVLTSPHTLDCVRRSGLTWWDLFPRGTRLATVGAATAAAARAEGLTVDLQPSPDESGGAALAQCFPDGPGTVVIPGAQTSAGTVEPGLIARGWRVVSVPFYVTDPVTHIDDLIRQRWDQGEYAAFVATSPSTVQAVASTLGPTVPVVAIGPSSATAARAAGFPQVVLTRSTDPGDILEAITSLTGSPADPHLVPDPRR
ncbi:MAG: uroporphyrinogen-III synthase [Propionibacteriaceae bacterium]|nr:uroporphyrinogen-III synthase [Propionibacteriaceae bacterium]